MEVVAYIKVPYGVLVAVAFVLAMLFPASAADPSLSPAQPPIASDGTSLDQGIAYVLMLLALLLTYIIHLAELPISL
ncbi:arabinogalactan peptide 22-like [Cucurbita maxima]|uniref:Arabinogalactan peptide 22-like n=1 Tax=Cucurbita maxima TaxID=3661 RepID=A0A6J1K4A3_CUCMA|nr:arabinogalactan peptide 22-like [Cucurbita maxima]